LDLLADRREARKGRNSSARALGSGIKKVSEKNDKLTTEIETFPCASVTETAIELNPTLTLVVVPGWGGGVVG